MSTTTGTVEVFKDLLDHDPIPAPDLAHTHTCIEKDWSTNDVVSSEKPALGAACG